jgi:hypothetical protein
METEPEDEVSIREDTELAGLVTTEIELQMSESILTESPDEISPSPSTHRYDPIVFWKRKKDWCRQQGAELKVLLRDFADLHYQKIDYSNPHFRVNYFSLQESLQILLQELTILKSLYYCWLFQEYDIPLSDAAPYLAARSMMTYVQVQENIEQIAALINVLSAMMPKETYQWLLKENHLHEVIFSFHYQGYTLSSLLDMIYSWKEQDQIKSQTIWQDYKYSTTFFMAKRCKRFIDLLETFVHSQSFFDYSYYILMEYWVVIHDVISDKDPFGWISSTGKRTNNSRNDRCLARHLTRVVHLIDSTLLNMIRIKGTL